MKYRFEKAKDGYKLIKDPDGEKKVLGTYKTIQAGKSKLRSIIRGE